MRTLWVALLLSGCTAGLPRGATTPDGPQRAALSAAIETWRAAGLPWRAQCDEEYTRLHIVVAPPDTFTHVCRNRPLKAGGRLYACSLTQREHTWPWSVLDRDRVPLLVISALEPRDHRRRLVIHEAMHWLGHCSGKGIDYGHADVRVWQRVLGVAEQRMKSRLAAAKHGFGPRHALMFGGIPAENRR
ncbi:MAG: hypothetical protein MJD61_02975 [Proteobacteria bacterium]|nr:hypothetical protein [Pseudomonadota bacterium]